MVNTCWLIPHNSKWPLSSLPHFKCLTFSEFRVFWVPLWYPKIIMFKNMTFKLKKPYCTCHYEVWVRFYILLKFEDFSIIFNEKWYFCKFYEISKNHENWMGSNFWSRMTIQMIDTALQSWKYIFFEKKKFGYHLGTMFSCDGTFVRFIDILSIEQCRWIRRISW